MSAAPPSFRFWRRWLLAALAMQVLVGYLVVFLEAPMWDWHQSRVALALWGSPDFPPEVAAYRRWVGAVLGATMAAWAVAMLWVAAVPFARRERWAWWCLLTSPLAWFPVDTALSVYHGVTVNALFNLAPLAMMAPPLAFTYRHLKRG